MPHPTDFTGRESSLWKYHRTRADVAPPSPSPSLTHLDITGVVGLDLWGVSEVGYNPQEIFNLWQDGGTRAVQVGAEGQVIRWECSITVEIWQVRVGERQRGQRSTEAKRAQQEMHSGLLIKRFRGVPPSTQIITHHQHRYGGR